MSKADRLTKKKMRLSIEHFKLIRKKYEGKGGPTQKEIDNFSQKVKAFESEVAKETAKIYDRREKERERRKKGGCFISTMVMTALGQDDDCAELTLLREFRDRTLLATLEGRRMVQIYYEISPELTEILVEEGRQNSGIYQELYAQFICPVLSFITEGNFARAIELYGEMLMVVYALSQKPLAFAQPPNPGGRADGNRKQRGSRALTF